MDNQNNNSTNFSIEDVEDYRNESVEYSHQTLVMKAMKRVIELGGHELAEGINETTTDPKRGTTKVIYKEDTKKAFIEAILTCKMMMVCDFDEGADENIEAGFNWIKKLEEDFLKEQWDYWYPLNPKQRANLKTNVFRNYFNSTLPFQQMFKDKEIQIYRLIFEELVLLTKRLGFYAVDEIEG